MACKCNVGLKDLGYPDCSVMMDTAKYLIFTDLTDSLSINTSPGVTEDYYANDFGGGRTAWANAPNEYITAKVSNFTWTKADPTTETLDDGVPLFVSDGRVTLEWLFARAPAGLLQYLERLRCYNSLGMYIVDKAGRIWGITDDVNNLLKPIPLLSESFVIKFEPTTNTTLQKITLKVTLDYFEESKLRGLGASISAWDSVTKPVATELYSINLPTNGGTDFDADLLTLFGIGTYTYSHVNGMTNASDWTLTINGTATAISNITEVAGSPYTQPDALMYRFTSATAFTTGDAVTLTFNGSGRYGRSTIQFIVP